VAGVALTALGWRWWGALFSVDAVVAVAVCVAGVALGNIDLHGWLWWCAWFPVDAVDLHLAWQA